MTIDALASTSASRGTPGAAVAAWIDAFVSARGARRLPRAPLRASCNRRRSTGSVSRCDDGCSRFDEIRARLDESGARRRERDRNVRPGGARLDLRRAWHTLAPIDHFEGGARQSESVSRQVSGVDRPCERVARRSSRLCPPDFVLESSWIAPRPANREPRSSTRAPRSLSSPRRSPRRSPRIVSPSGDARTPRAAVVETRAARRTIETSLGSLRASLGTTRASLGTSRASLGTSRASLVACRATCARVGASKTGQSTSGSGTDTSPPLTPSLAGARPWFV